MTKNTASSTAATASSPSVSTDVHPFWLPLTIAYTAIISEAVTVTAPPMSRRRPPARSAAWSAGKSRRHSTTTRTPIGKLTRKIQCQLITSVRIPPSSTPMLPPPAATKPKKPIAFARSAGSVKRPIISESDTADATAPPTP